MPLVLLATASEWPDLSPDDQLLAPALRRRGLEPRPAVWDDPAVEWEAADLVVVRSVWDYVERRDGFLAWAARVAQRAALHNPAPVLAWNSHKGYLLDLESEGCDVVPTAVLPSPGPASVRSVLDELGWVDGVVKPAVSAGARRTVRVDARRPDSLAAAQAHVDAVLPEVDVLVQPYVHATEGAGEHALIHVDGRLTHTVRKLPALAGGEYSSFLVEPCAPDPREVALARSVLARFDPPLLYARVDCVVGDDGVARLMELEVIEPQLYFGHAPNAAEAMAAAIASRME